jgi:hypothetical protein
MPEIPPLPELPPTDERAPWMESVLRVDTSLRQAVHQLDDENRTLRDLDASLRQSVHQLREENQALRDEIARLKNQKPKPPIQPSRLNERDKKRRGKGKAKPYQKPLIDRTVVVKAADVPKGSRFKGYDDFVAQELLMTAQTTRYRLEKWLTPEGKLITGRLPLDKTGGHFGPTLTSFVLYQYYHAQVTEPLILEALHEWGVRISSGQLHRLLVEGKEAFHEEKNEILRVGLQGSGHIHADDTGARHQGKNGYCTHIGNEWFAWFQSTESKSRINFLQLLRAGHTDYALNGEALEYMTAQHLPAQPLARLAATENKAFADAPQWQAFLRASGITAERHVRIATEGALLGSAFEHGLNPQLALVSDDAGQFNVLCHALCWIHAERVLAKLVGFNDAQRADLERVRTLMWQLYRDIQHYRTAPTEAAKENLKARFESLCATTTCFASLNGALKRMRRNQAELLLALERPGIPLHNNLSETDIREYVKRRKISGGTRSDAGRRGRDTFASLKKTCRKLGVSFWRYLNDRIRKLTTIPPLAALIQARAQAP